MADVGRGDASQLPLRLGCLQRQRLLRGLRMSVGRGAERRQPRWGPLVWCADDETAIFMNGSAAKNEGFRLVQIMFPSCFQL